MHPLKNKSSPSKLIVRGVSVFFVVLLVGVYLYLHWMNVRDTWPKSIPILTGKKKQSDSDLWPKTIPSIPRSAPDRFVPDPIPSVPIPFSCPIEKTNLTCPQPPPPLPTISDKQSPTCPEYFRWIHEDQTRDVFTMWGIIQLLRRYPGRLPDVDIMFECNDFPVIKVVDHQPPATVPPPLFSYCRDHNTFDIVFPDWSYFPSYCTLARQELNRFQ